MLCRASTEERAELIRATLRRCASGIAYAAFVGLFVNALYLIVPFYMIQVYDRVMSSRSFETLTMLTIIAAAGLVCLATLDYVRARVFMIVGEQFARRLSGPTLEAAVCEVAAQPVGRQRQRHARSAGIAAIRHQRSGGAAH